MFVARSAQRRGRAAGARSPAKKSIAAATPLPAADVDRDEARTLRPLRAAAITYRIAFGPQGEHKSLTLMGAMPREATPHQPLCAGVDGFSLHAAVCAEANELQ